MKKIIKSIKQRIKNKEINNMLNDYPCSDYLHNALHFLKQGKTQVAYNEICHAIIRSGGKLTDSESIGIIPKKAGGVDG